MRTKTYHGQPSVAPTYLPNEQQNLEGQLSRYTLFPLSYCMFVIYQARVSYLRMYERSLIEEFSGSIPRKITLSVL